MREKEREHVEENNGFSNHKWKKKKKPHKELDWFSVNVDPSNV